MASHLPLTVRSWGAQPILYKTQVLSIHSVEIPLCLPMCDYKRQLQVGISGLRTSPVG